MVPAARCPTCGNAARVSTRPAEHDPATPAEAELACCGHYAYASGRTQHGAASRAVARWAHLFGDGDGADGEG